MSDEQGVRRTLALYCQLCDDGRFDEWAELFTEGARFTVMGGTHAGRDNVKAWIEAAQPPERRGKHFLGQSVVDFEPDGLTATGVTDYTFVSKRSEGYVITSAGRYHDTLHRGDDGRWRFDSREIRFLGD
ncbi:MAG TPA: nuclear transport factor 2 family protein [Acidimicrobiales bacterium]